MQNWTQSSCLFRSRFACAQAAIFFAKPYSINAGKASIVLWVAACIHHSAIQTKIERHFGGFFHQITVRQPIGRQDSMQPLDPNKQEVGFNFAWSGSELWSCFKYSALKLKNQKHIAVDVLLKGFQWYHSHADPIWPDGTFKKLRICGLAHLRSSGMSPKFADLRFSDLKKSLHAHLCRFICGIQSVSNSALAAGL